MGMMHFSWLTPMLLGGGLGLLVFAVYAVLERRRSKKITWKAAARSLAVGLILGTGAGFIVAAVVSTL